MITAIDTSVLLDMALLDPVHASASRDALAAAYERGGLVICEVVYAELAPAYREREELDDLLRAVGIALEPVGEKGAWEAGKRWEVYRRSRGPRTRTLSDFLIGAHALTNGYRLLTRDRGFYRKYFEGVVVVEP